MAANIIAKLIHGGDELDLVSYENGTGNYGLGLDFAPPTAYPSTTYGQASAWGQQKINEEEQNQTWAFIVHIRAGNASEAKRSERVLQAFLNRAGDEAEPLYFAWRPWADYTFEPTHGTFGKFARYEIVDGKVALPGNYYTLKTASYVGATVQLTIKPMSQIRILAGTAAGGIVEDIYKSTNGQSRGVRICADTTQYVTNPVFENLTLWSTGWTAGSGVDASQNTNQRFVMFGRSSAELVYDGTAGATAAMYRISATVGSAISVVLSCYVKRRDGTEFNPGDLYFVKGTTPTVSAWDVVGDGWTRMWCTITSAAGAESYGVQLATAENYFYMDGFSIQAGTMPKPICYGDQVGSVWVGTPNESTSTRPATYYLRWPRKNIINYTEGSIRLAWKPETDLLDSRNYHLFTDFNIQLFYTQSTNKFTFKDKVNTALSSSYAGTIDGETVIIFHAVWSQAGLFLYANGVQIATSTFTVPPLADWVDQFYLGTDYGGSTTPCGGVLSAFATFDRAMTAAQVLADYNQAAAQVADDTRIDDIPWVWTFNAGGILYNQNDTAQGNYLISGGFGGDMVTPELIATTSSDWNTIEQIHFGRLAIDQRDYAQIIPGIEGSLYSLLFHDESGTADVGNSSGDAYQTRTLTTSAVNLGGFVDSYTRQNTYLYGKPVGFLGRVRDSGGGASANLQVAIQMYFGFSIYVTEYRNLPALGTTDFGLIDFGQVTFPVGVRYRPEGEQITYLYAVPKIKRSTGSSAFLCDYIALFPYPMHLKNIAGASANQTILIIKGNSAHSGGGIWTTGKAVLVAFSPLEFNGYPLEFGGRKLNLINVAIGAANLDEVSTITWTLTINELWLTIRNQIG